ncbi:VQ motif-containing family protein [Salix suchowensis]|nr:VQ motif-containing family protein [Salix suchowensis]
MASSENLASLEPWNMMFRPTLSDCWISEAFARDTETLTKALQKSIFNNIDDIPMNTTPIIPTASPTPTASNVSGSDPETAGVTKRQRNPVPGATGRVSKRKSRASKRSQTTFISADPANFRQMVQQVTGVRFNNSQVSMWPVQGGSGCLPTLDTSAFLLDHHQQQVVMGSTPGSSPGSGPVSFTQPMMGGSGGGSSGGLDFDTFSSFPTLESWKVV